MGKPQLHIRLRPAAEGLKAEIVASPEIWQAIAENGGDWSLRTDDTSILLELPSLSWPAAQGEPNVAIEVIALNTRAGADEVDDDPKETVYVWDDDRGFVLRDDE